MTKASKNMSTPPPQTFSLSRRLCLVHTDGGEQAELVQSLVGFPAAWIACGNSHSVVIGATGGAMAFGLNTHSQVLLGFVLVCYVR